jgi:uncharacterized protein (DUF1501 family)
LLTSGWLNRVMGLVPGVGTMQSGINLGTMAPLLVRGGVETAGWAPDPFAQLASQSANDLQNLLSPDPLLGPAYQAGFADRVVFNTLMKANPYPSGLTSLQTFAWAAGDFLGAPNGPQIAALQTPSFDTHEDQVARLNTGLAELDTALLMLKTKLGAAWANTVVMTMTEFGRTAAANGDASSGTDHGTGFAVLLAGGAVRGGHVFGTWPGLAAARFGADDGYKVGCHGHIGTASGFARQCDVHNLPRRRIVATDDGLGHWLKTVGGSLLGNPPSSCAHRVGCPRATHPTKASLSSTMFRF